MSIEYVPKSLNTRVNFQLFPPTLASNGLEISVHECPRLLLRELSHVFSTVSCFQKQKQAQRPILAVLTVQKAQMDLSQFGRDADQEKDNLLENFIQWAQGVAQTLTAKNYWCDFIDPCSGLPMLTMNSTKVYSEVDGVELLLKYRSNSAGMCKILLHPEWGAAMYPASLFTNAPFDVVEELLQNYMED